MDKKCSLSWCNKPARGSYCNGHWANKYKHGVPNPPILAKRVGTRTLLAKTCGMCGELKDAREFRLKKMNSKAGGLYHDTNCTPCVIVYNRTHGPKDPKKYQKYSYHKLTREQQLEHQNALKRMNAETRDTASNLHQPWTGADLNYALDPANGTVKERALKLGRTYKSVENQITIHRREMKKQEAK